MNEDTFVIVVDNVMIYLEGIFISNYMKSCYLVMNIFCVLPVLILFLFNRLVLFYFWCHFMNFIEYFYAFNSILVNHTVLLLIVLHNFKIYKITSNFIVLFFKSILSHIFLYFIDSIFCSMGLIFHVPRKEFRN